VRPDQLDPFGWVAVIRLGASRVVA
jgi:hypothetical protein